MAMITASLALSACATFSPEQKVRANLIKAGLSPHMAGCMANKMVDRLSLGQLRELQSLASLGKADMGGMSIDRFLHKVRSIKDPEIFIVTSRAALSCAL
jgi:hypothetical protein